jgi:hypothetical protein
MFMTASQPAANLMIAECRATSSVSSSTGPIGEAASIDAVEVVGRKMQTEERRREVSLPSLIAWLSLCLLSAAWGRSISGPCQNLWMQGGTFGIVAAVGLGSLEKARKVCKASVRDQLLQSRVENRLVEWGERSTALESIKQALDEITKTAATHGAPLEGFPLEIVMVKGNESFDCTSAESLPGRLKSFAASVVNFEHQDFVTEPVVVLVFDLAVNRQMCLVVNMTGTQANEAGFSSCGTALAAGVPQI